MSDSSLWSRLVVPDLAGKAILVTGASTGIGAAVAEALGHQRSKVGLHYNASEEPARKVAAAIEQAGGSVVLIQGDVAEAGEADRVVQEAAEKLGGLDGLINNAGSMLGRFLVEETTDEQFERVINLNARSVLAATRAALPFLKASGSGFIINTSSIAARHGGGGGSTLYAAAKGFVSTITHGHAKEFAGDNIRVNAVSPGTIATAFHERYSTPERLKAMAATIPNGRIGVAEDCVGAFLFLASGLLSGYVTGQVLEVNGGQFML